MRKLAPLGPLKQDPNIPQWWYSKPVPVPFCSAKAIRFNVRSEADGDRYPPDVDEAVRNFLALTDQDRLAASERVFRHYRQSVSLIPETDLGVSEPDQIWQHVRPTGVCVDRYDEGDGLVYVRLVCECDWEEEHGLQLLFRHGTTITLVGEHEDGNFVEEAR
jgi:Domain of unknown function (DUF6985)